jgi:predicted ATPase
MKFTNKKLLINHFTLKKSEELKRDKLVITNDYPFSIPIIKSFKSFEFRKPVTFFIGENGSGKSTLIEAFANCCGFNTEGGSRNFKFSTRSTDSKFYKYLNIGHSVDFPVADGYFLRSETLYNLASVTETLYPHLDKTWEIPSDYGEKSLHEQSHGESILSLLENRITKRGLYIFDEPETGLSVKNLFAMLRIIDNLTKIQSQFIICTHSPILLAFPDSEIYDIINGSLQKVKYEETDSYTLNKYFLVNYKGMLNKLGLQN